MLVIVAQHCEGTVTNSKFYVYLSQLENYTMNERASEAIPNSGFVLGLSQPVREALPSRGSEAGSERHSTGRIWGSVPTAAL